MNNAWNEISLSTRLCLMFDRYIIIANNRDRLDKKNLLTVIYFLIYQGSNIIFFCVGAK